ncbi:MAG: glycine cleavage system aminomethyltransferase GcvT [Magnetococcales bacterium]|nr:glycine cleavage system aminomethyltransferase GcvT [Magnetococcales bacterium]NGZ06060.1 glycine cleavage system aminomethyltransferase GcvT [Magnetococcales bacterium]
MHKTVLHDRHIGLGARLAPFAGWEMPLHYGSQIQEHHAVRRACGVFDVSHMGVIDLSGGDVLGLLRWVLACDAARLTDGAGQYGLMLSERGGVADDLIVYRLSANLFTLVVNAGNRDKDLTWLRIHAPAYRVTVTERHDLAILALQGPEAVRHLSAILPPALVGQAAALLSFHLFEAEEGRVARTGYTGEDGFELILPSNRAGSVWDRLLKSGVVPAGLGARDTLRLEAGMNLHGRDMHDKTNPLERGLGWTIAWEPPGRAFVGRQAVELTRHDPALKKRIGLVLQERGVLRDHQVVLRQGQPVGEITSGGYSPTLEAGIALAVVDAGLQPGELCQVEVRGRLLQARAVRPPFVRMGQSVIRD